MTRTRVDQPRSWEENIGILTDELDLAIHWNRPSILLAIHKSNFGQEKAQKALTERLRKMGQRVKSVLVNEEHPDIPHTLMEALDAFSAEKTTFFVSNIEWGGGENGKEAYRGLNIYRELFVEKRIKVVFWLTMDEAANLPRYAPDFWAFRHRVVEFASSRATKGINLPAGVLIWDIQELTDLLSMNQGQSIDSRERSQRIKEKISELKEMLTKLPQNMEARSARIELLYNIGYLHWRLNNSGEAKAAFTNGLELAPDAALPGTKAQLLHGLAVLDYEAGHFASSADIYKKALALSPHDSSLLINLSATCCMLGRNHEAITNSKRALRVNASDGRIWDRLGYIYVAMGKMPEAVTCFLKAVEVAPKISAYHESLAVVYSLTDRSDQSLRELTISRQLSGARPGWELDLYKEAILGHTEQALESLKAALNEKWILIHEVRRDPNLNVLLKSAEIVELINKLAT